MKKIPVPTKQATNSLIKVNHAMLCYVCY